MVRARNLVGPSGCMGIDRGWNRDSAGKMRGVDGRGGANIGRNGVRRRLLCVG